MVITELLDHIESATTLTVGSDLFLGVYPGSNRSGVLLGNLGGVHNDTDMGAIQILINARYQDYVTTSNIIGSVYNVLAYSNGIVLPSHTIFNSIPVSMPQYLGKDDMGFIMFSAIINLFTEV